jgi:hypothetical protein
MWLLKLGAAIFLIAIGIWWAVRMNTVMWNAAASDPNALQAKAGETTKVVVEITEATSGGEIRGKILKEKTKEVYTRTGEQISARSNAETKYVMGNAADVRAFLFSWALCGGHNVSCSYLKHRHECPYHF